MGEHGTVLDWVVKGNDEDRIRIRMDPNRLEWIQLDLDGMDLDGCWVHICIRPLIQV